eukprot:10468527-Lingulodinium_polyedra.AAC.1
MQQGQHSAAQHRKEHSNGHVLGCVPRLGPAISVRLRFRFEADPRLGCPGCCWDGVAPRICAVSLP